MRIVERLRDRDNTEDEYEMACEAADEIERLTALLEQAEAALEPFGAMAEFLDDTAKRRDAIYCGGSPGLRCEVTQADYHRARALLAKLHRLMSLRMFASGGGSNWRFGVDAEPREKVCKVDVDASKPAFIDATDN